MTPPISPDAAHPAIIDELQAAAYVAMSRGFLRVARTQDRGPAYVRIGRSIRYRVADLDAWLDARRVRTSEGSR